MRTILISVVAGLLALTACSSERSAFPDDGKENIVASFFPLAEAVRGVRGMDSRVVDLTPPGVEPHDLEIDNRQVERIEDADYVVLLEGDFQPAVERAARRAKGKVIRIPVEGDDPHIWLDPVRMARIVELVATATKADAAAFSAELAALDADYKSGLANCARKTLVTAHDAFGLLAKRYGLTVEPITGISPEAEPDAQRLNELATVIKRTGTTTVFTESLVSPRVAETLAREAGVKTDVLDPMESGVPGGYMTGMRENLKRLRGALGCT